MQNMFRTGISVIIMLLTVISANSQILTLDDFENKNEWSFNQSDGVIMNLSNEKGISGNAIRIDYDFTKGTGFGGIQKLFPLDLPENFELKEYPQIPKPHNKLNQWQ